MDLPRHVLQLLNSADTIKILGVYTSAGDLDLVPLTTIKAPRPNLILVPQIIGTEAQSDIVEAMEQGQSVSVLCLEPLHGGKHVYQMTCAVREYQTAGPLYEKFIDELRVSYTSLRGVWVLEPLNVKTRR